MLLPAQVIPFLGHEDHFVRDHAGRYFYDAHDVTPLTADAVWEAIDRLDPQESAARLVALLGRLPQSDASTERLLTAFDVDKLCDVEEDLWDAVHDIDFEQLRRHRARILALPNLPDDVGEHLSARLELAEAPPETLWDRLLAQIDATRGKYWDQIDHAESDRAVEALARHGEPVAARATQWLESPVLTPGQEGRGGADDDTSIYAVQLLGRMRYRPALDLLLKTLVECDEENDVLHEQLMAAIPRVGGADAVAPIEAEFPRQGQAYRLYAAGLLGRIKHPAAEAAVVRLVEDPALSAARTELGIALAELCPTDGLSALKRLVLDGDYDPYMAELKGDLVACALMADFNFPELGALREEVIAKEIESDRRMEALASRMLDGNGPDDHFDEYEDDAPAHPALPAELDDRYPPVVAPIRTEPKVGRNDPCPCGSGKKYKKCCLDKSA